MIIQFLDYETTRILLCYATNIFTLKIFKNLLITLVRLELAKHLRHTYS